MKSAIALAAFGLVLLSFARHADADVFTPSSTNFTWVGPVIIAGHGVKLGCQGTIDAQTNSTGALRVTSVFFSGGQGCSLVKGSGLPWTATATGATTLTISKVSFILSGGLCGPGVIPANLGGGVLAFNAVNNFAGCSIAGGLRSAPPIRIVP